MTHASPKNANTCFAVYRSTPYDSNEYQSTLTNLWVKNLRMSVLVLLDKMCSSGVAIAYFCAWEANSHSWSDADVVAVCSIGPSWWPNSQKSTIKRLRNVFGTLQIFSLTKTLTVWRIGQYRELISWYPASKLTQALNPLKLRHLYRTVTSGRLGAKGCVCLNSFQREFSGLWGNSSIIDDWFVTL